MQFKTVKELILEKVRVEAKIRALRVIEVRRLAAILGSKRTIGLIHKLDDLERKIRGVYYIHQEVDDLLDEIEDLLSSM
jgi:hypothetical protein